MPIRKLIEFRQKMSGQNILLSGTPDGDGIPDLVLHSDPTCIKEELNGSGWYLNLFYKKFGHMFIHPFSDFLQAVSL